jgi:hypothetical protein
MKKLLLAFLILAAAGTFTANFRTHAAETQMAQTYEYATIRWGGRDNTHVIRPSGKVEFVGSQLMKVKRPERVDDRSFYMNIVMNALAKEGYEFAGMTNDEIVMKRAIDKK